MTTAAASKLAPQGPRRNPRNELAQQLFLAMFAGPYGAKILSSTSPDALESAARLSVKAADAFFKVSAS
ncbi:hypothetical protein J7E62_27505 [Variovorax paradoxus]|nr:hypothetical protein [Variovorax paradoxus]